MLKYILPVLTNTDIQHALAETNVSRTHPTPGAQRLLIGQSCLNIMAGYACPPPLCGALKKLKLITSDGKALTTRGQRFVAETFKQIALSDDVVKNMNSHISKDFHAPDIALYTLPASPNCADIIDQLSALGYPPVIHRLDSLTHTQTAKRFQSASSRHEKVPDSFLVINGEYIFDLNDAIKELNELYLAQYEETA